MKVARNSSCKIQYFQLFNLAGRADACFDLLALIIISNDDNKNNVLFRFLRVTKYYTISDILLY